jgi:excisionase family DNA binding protein
MRKVFLREGTWGNDEAANYLGCTPDTLRVWVSQRRVPFVKVGRLTRFRRMDLDEFLNQNLVQVAVGKTQEDVAGGARCCVGRRREPAADGP